MAPRTRLRSIVLGAVAVSAAGLVGVGCLQDFDAFSPGTGGGSSTSTTTVVSSSSGDMTSSSSGDPPECTPATVVADCPAAPNDCDQPVCTAAGECDVGPKMAHEDCMTAGPQQDGPGVCTGASVCIGCIDVSDCPLDGMGNAQLCPQAGPQANVCVPAGCTNTEKDGLETDVDCGGAGVAPCPKCDNDKVCLVNTDCASGSCQAGLCKPCAVQGDCEAANYCDTTATPTAACKLKETQGTACTLGNDQCGSGFCTDGFCCDKSCGSTCESCRGSDHGGADGTCDFVTAGTDPSPGECDTTGNGCKTGTCNGAGACGFKMAGDICGSGPSCVTGSPSISVNPQDVCAGGSDTCNSPAAVNCNAGFTCTGTACNTTCTQNNHCVNNNCETTPMSPKLGQCVTCNGTGDCGGGLQCEESISSTFEDTCVECRQAPANTDCAADNTGHSCLVATDTCGCTADSHCTGIANNTRCALTGGNSNSCQECNTDANCSTDNNVKGFDCSPTGGPANKCGCTAATEGTACTVAGAGRCATSAGANQFTCQQCESDAQCLMDNNLNGHDCSPSAGLTNKCGCDADTDCTGIANRTKCFLTGSMFANTCQECFVTADCTTNNNGHVCNPTVPLTGKCGCAGDGDCTAPATCGGGGTPNVCGM